MFLDSTSRNQFRAFYVVIGLVIALAGCGKGNEDAGGHGPGQAGAAGHGGQGGRPEQPPVPVATVPATIGSISSTYSANATLEAEAEAQILARVAGVVQTLNAEEGERVRTGQALLQIEAGEYHYRLEQAKASTANLASQFSRQQDMVGRGLVSQEAFDSVQSELANAEAAEGLAELELSYTTVRSPFTGRVVQRLVDAGQNVSVGTPLFMVADFEPLLAKVHVPSKEFRQLTTDQPVALRLDSDDTQLSGQIKLVSPVIDPSSGTIKVTIEIPTYPAGVRPGDFAEVRIVTERRDNRILVPRVGLLSDKGEDIVYVESGGKAERRVVELGITDDDFAEILSGVNEGDLIIVKGQRSLRHGQSVRVLEGEASPAVETEAPDGHGKREGA